MGAYGHIWEIWVQNLGASVMSPRRTYGDTREGSPSKAPEVLLFNIQLLAHHSTELEPV